MQVGLVDMEKGSKIAGLLVVNIDGRKIILFSLKHCLNNKVKK